MRIADQRSTERPGPSLRHPIAENSLPATQPFRAFWWSRSQLRLFWRNFRVNLPSAIQKISCSRLHHVRGDPHSLRRVGLTEDFRMENLREDLGALNNTRAGPAKVSSCVRGPNFTASDSRQIIPAFGQARIWQLPQDIFFVIAAGNQHNYFRRVSNNLFRICGHAAFTSFAKCVIATGNCNLFGHPVTGGERGLQPFQHQGSWATLDVRCLLSDAIEPRAEAANKI